MLQLADIYVWSLQLASGTMKDSKYPRPELVRFLREETELLAPHRYKEWPTAQSRFQ